MKKWEIIVACIASVALIVWGTSFGKSEIKIDGKDKVILPIQIGGGDGSWRNCMKEVAAEYMKQNPDVEIHIRIVDKGDFTHAESIVIEEALGKTDGIIEMKNARLYADAGKLAPLPKTLTDQMRQVDEIDGQIYSISRYYSGRGIIYNKEIFDQCGLEVPETYRDFLNVCQILKSQGYAPLTIGAENLWHLSNWLTVLYEKNINKKNPNWAEQCRKGETHWTDEEPKQMLRDFEQLFRRGFVEGTYADTTDTETIELLAEGRAAMLCSGTWMFSQIMNANPQFQLGWFFLPNDEDYPPLVLNSEWEWVITKECKDNGLYDTAVDFLEFFYSEEIYKGVLQDMSGLSSLKENIVYEAIPVQKEIIEAMGRQEVAEENLNGMGNAPEGFTNKLYQNMLKLAEGEQTVDETAEMLEQGWRKDLGQN